MGQFYSGFQETVKQYQIKVEILSLIHIFPNELLEASQMDGCSDFMYYIKVVIPLSKAIIAVLVLFYGVGQDVYKRQILQYHLPRLFFGILQD